MKFVIQRVLEGSVKVNGEIVGRINKGLVVLVGFTHSDKSSDIKFAANKLLNIRLWDDDKGVRWKECVKSKNYEILLVSQFTLYSFFKGNKPDFHKALEPDDAVKLYQTFVETLKKNYVSEKIQTGRFGEMMEVSLINDGPVTINWDYPEISDKENNVDGAENKIEENIKKENEKLTQNKEKCNNKINLKNSKKDKLIDLNADKFSEKNKKNEIVQDFNKFKITDDDTNKKIFLEDKSDNKEKQQIEEININIDKNI